MRYINLSRIKIPSDWLKKAENARNALLRLDEKDRSSFIEKNSGIWKALKHELEKVSHYKCWYCERKVIRFFFHVDHYRPKNNIINDDGASEEGYWWLAFDFENFRLACQFCNCLHKGKDGISCGKGNRFPLCAGSIKASPESDIHDEKPLLLDPTEQTDPPLLWFNDDGSIKPTYDSLNKIFYQRAEKTIEILDLNDFKIKEQRKNLKIFCDRIISRGDQAYESFQKNSTAGRERFKIVLIEAKELIDEKAEFSATARAYFVGSNRSWVERFLTHF